MTTIDTILADEAPPVVAILRGVKPDEAVTIGQALLAMPARPASYSS